MTPGVEIRFSRRLTVPSATAGRKSKLFMRPIRFCYWRWWSIT